MKHPFSAVANPLKLLSNWTQHLQELGECIAVWMTAIIFCTKTSWLGEDMWKAFRITAENLHGQYHQKWCGCYHHTYTITEKVMFWHERIRKSNWFIRNSTFRQLLIPIIHSLKCTIRMENCFCFEYLPLHTIIKSTS